MQDGDHIDMQSRLEDVQVPVRKLVCLHVVEDSRTRAYYCSVTFSLHGMLYTGWRREDEAGRVASQ